MRCGNDGYIISFLVGHKKPIWLKIISVIVLKTCETEGEKHCKALKIKVFREYPDWPYAPEKHRNPMDCGAQSVEKVQHKLGFFVHKR